MRFLCVTAALALASCTFDYKVLEGTPSTGDAGLDVSLLPSADGGDMPLTNDGSPPVDSPRGDVAVIPDVPLFADVGVSADHPISPPETGGLGDAKGGLDVDNPGTGGTSGTGGTGGQTAAGGASGMGGATTGGATGTGGVVGPGGATTGGATGTGGSTGAEPPSCQGKTFRCGAANESCCTTIHLAGGTFPMGRGSGTDAYAGRSNEVPEHTATVGPFSLDKYEVTVGRMKTFLVDYDRWRQAGNPLGNAGANPNMPGLGTGWPNGSPLSTTAADLRGKLNCNPDTNTATIDAGNDAYPANCVTYYEGLAFCIWDGGRLPTEAEWEFAAAGGDENRLYPWSSSTVDSTRANFSGCVGCAATPKVVVGSYPAGAGRYGHLDLAGSVTEWVIDQYQADWYSAGGSTCSNCANLDISLPYRVMRGSSFRETAGDIRVAYRDYSYSNTHYQFHGIRCARDP